VCECSRGLSVAGVVVMVLCATNECCCSVLPSWRQPTSQVDGCVKIGCGWVDLRDVAEVVDATSPEISSAKK
jgi:hypothetical protein